jgi:2-amino-4-hydroxy-6-hydroxymethyldihydropteridine diphosphokinase
MPRVYVSIGSNVERERNVHGAVQALATRFGALDLSQVYETRAEGFDGDNFYNLVAGFDTDAPIEQVRSWLREIETAHGRDRNIERYGPRTLDIDVLLYGDLVRHDDGIDVPRPEILRSAFVLGPLAEIAPALCHPETGERLADAWQRFETKPALQAVGRISAP